MNNFVEVIAKQETFSRENQSNSRKKNKNASVNLFRVPIKASLAPFQDVSTMSFQEI